MRPDELHDKLSTTNGSLLLSYLAALAGDVSYYQFFYILSLDTAVFVS